MSDAIAVKLPNQNVTVVGAFNPAIFDPAWVRRHIPSVGDQISVGFNPSGGPLISRAGELCWIVASDRLVVYGPVDRAGRMVAEILDILPHTPLRACGVNFLFVGRSDRPSEVRIRDSLRGTLDEFAVSRVALREDGIRVTAKVLWPSEEPEALLDLNYHLEATGPQSLERAKQLVAHASRASEFDLDAKRIFRELLGE